jgi:hypothetical protein
LNLENDEIDRLLARGRLGGPRHESIAARVIASSARRARPAAAPLAGAIAVGGLGAILLVGRLTSHGEDGFHSKGQSADKASLDLTCVGGSLGACPVGSTLMFSAGGMPEKAFLGAYADPDGPGQRIWYFSARTEAPLLARGDGPMRPLRRGIRIGAEHTSRRYRVHVLLTGRPLDPGATTPPLAEAIFDLAVVR